MKKKGFIQKAAVSLLLVLLLLGLLPGCAGKKGKGLKTVEGNPEVLYKQGLVLFNSKHYKDALEKFEQIKSNFPDSPPFTIWAELKAADTHFFRKSYVEAAVAYEEFKKVHPTFEEITYVQFQIGMSYFSQMTTPDRDQTLTKKALSSFEYLIASYPPNLFTEKAKDKVEVCKRQLAGHEFFVGQFYYRHEKFQAAAIRFEGLLEKFPKWRDEDKVLLSLGKSYVELNQGEKARQTLVRLVNDYPRSPSAKEARKILGKGLIEKKTASRKAKAKGKSPEPEPEGLVIVKYEEEGKRAIAFQEERAYLPAPPVTAPLSPVSPELASPAPAPVEEEKAKAVPEAQKAEERPEPLPSAVPMEESRAKAVSEAPRMETASPGVKKEDDLKAAFIPGEEPPQSLPPSAAPMEGSRAKAVPEAPKMETASPGMKKEDDLKMAFIPGEEPPKSLPPTQVEPGTGGKPEGERRKAFLPGLLAPSLEKESPKKGGPGAPSEEAKFADGAYPIDITSDSVETFTKENMILFKGNVMARQKDMVIYSDSLEAVIIEDGKGIEKVIAGGNVKIQQGIRVANCQKAIFYNLNKRIVLTGDPKVTEGENIITGEEITFDIEENRIEVKGGTSGQGKVRIYPQEETEKKE
jgi:outer membrane protein assembly factor BamD